MSKIKLGIAIAKAAYKGVKAIKKNVAKNKDVIKSKEFLNASKKYKIPGYIVGGKWAVKHSKNIARKQELKSLTAKLKNMWKQQQIMAKKGLNMKDEHLRVKNKPKKLSVKRKGIAKLLLGDPSTNKNIKAAKVYYDSNIKNKKNKLKDAALNFYNTNIKGKSLTAKLKNMWKQQ